MQRALFGATKVSMFRPKILQMLDWHLEKDAFHISGSLSDRIYHWLIVGELFINRLKLLLAAKI